MKAPVFIAPAMDLDMYAHPSTQRNLEQLRAIGNYIIEPGSGFLASGLEGKGRMEEPEKIVAFLDDHLSENKGLVNRSILITAGPTYEKIDPVRFIGNYSSGKMGFALAEECARRGAQVTLVAGPVSLSINHPCIHRIDVESCLEMHAVATKAFPECDAAILCAAVADFRPETVSERKIKREKLADASDSSVPAFSLSLIPNPDIAADLGRMKQAGQLLVGFALETDDEQQNAEHKLQKKNLDFVVLNSLRNEGTCFQSNDNQIVIISSDGQRKDYPKKSKASVASDIVNELQQRLGGVE